MDLSLNSARGPPRPTGPLNGNEWIELSGKANILVKTSGVDGDFAIAKFEGSDNSAVVRLKGFKIDEMNGKISSCDPSQPSLNLIPIKSGND